MTRSAEDLKKEVVDQLYWDGRVDASEITVAIEDGKVVLQGSVPSLIARHFAASDALAVAGTYSVENQLTVRYPTSAVVPSDEQIRSNLEKLLEWSNDIDPEHIRIDVHNGVVTLEGSVDALWKTIHVEELLSRLTGVTAINNTLSAVPTKDTSDEIIAESVVKALTRNPMVNADAIAVTVANAVVRLTGAVPTWTAREIAHQSALHTFGVIGVDNQLIVAVEQQP